MIRPVIGTIGTRIALAVLNLLMVVVAGHRLGTEGLGTISLIILGISIILLLNNVVGGGGLVYLLPRFGDRALRWPSYAWALITAGVAAAVFHFVPVVPAPYAMHTVALAFLQSLCTIHLALLLGEQRIGWHNGILVLQAALLLVAFVFFLGEGEAEAMDHVRAAYVSFGATAVLSALAGWRTSNDGSSGGRNLAVVELFRQGGLAQGANGLQLLNYRLAYYLIQRWLGTAALGLYSVTVQLSESAWLIPKSLGLVLYARVSNMQEADAQRALALTALKVSLAITFAVVCTLLIAPEALYAWLFGPEVVGITPLILLLSPGLLAMAASQALSHYLSGTGRVHHNTIGSGIGTVITLAVGLYLIPAHGLKGAAATASLAYLASVIYQWILFSRITQTRLRDLLPDTADVERLHTLWNRVRGR